MDCMTFLIRLRKPKQNPLKLIIEINFFATRIIIALLRAYTSYFHHIYVCSGFCYFQKRKSKKSFFHPKDKLLKYFHLRVCNFGGRKFTFLIIRLCKTSHFASFTFIDLQL